MNTNRHEYRWTCLAATPSRDEGRERGRPARTTLAQPHPSSPPGSTGNGATTLLRPGPCGSRRRGGRLPHRRETERPPNPEDAGETPALPEGRLLPSFLLREEALPLPMRRSRPAFCAFKDEPRMHTKTDGPAWLRRRHGMKAGSAGVPPAQHWHGFTPLLHPARPAAAPRLCFGRARAVPAGGAAGCPIAGKLSGSQRHSMRAGRPRSR